MAEVDAHLAEKAVAQIRDALLALSWANDGWHEDEAQVAMDALDWLEAHALSPAEGKASS